MQFIKFAIYNYFNKHFINKKCFKKHVRLKKSLMFIVFILFFSISYAYAEDNTNNTTSNTTASNTITDAIAPSITILKPLADIYANTTLEMEATVSDESSIIRCDLLVDGSILVTLLPDNAGKIFTNLALSEGEHTLKLECEDEFGNIGDSEDVKIEIKTLETASTENTNEDTENTDFEDFKSSLKLSSDYEDIANTIINYIKDCVSKSEGNNQYDIKFSCMKDQYFIREELGKLVGVNTDDWKKIVDYIMVFSPGDPNYWIDDSGKIEINFDKMILKDKLGFNINPSDKTPQSKDEIWAGFWMNWDNYGGIKEDEIKKAEDDYRKWEDEQRQQKLLSELSFSVSSSQQNLGDEILNTVKPIFQLCIKYDSNPSGEKAYDLEYNRSIAEATLRGLSDTKDVEDLEKACNYAKKNLGYELDVWQDEFGETHIGRAHYTGKNIEVDFNCDYNEDREKTDMWVYVNWGSSANLYKEDIKKARRDAEIEARKAEQAGAIKEYMDSFSISSDLEETAESLVNDIDDFSEELESFDASKEDNFYNAEYNAQLLKAKFEGIGDVFNCDEFSQIRDYVILYTKYGSPEMWTDEFGDKKLSNHKVLLENKYFRFEINSWGCQEFDIEDKGGMNAELRWNLNEIMDSQKNLIKKARRDSQFEAEKLRRHNLLLKARQLVNFTVEEENIGKEIITKLEKIRNEAINYEKEPSADKAYNLTYNLILLRSELEGLAMSHPEILEGVGKYVVLYGPGMPDVWMNEMGDVEVGGNLQIFRAKDLQINFNMWIDEMTGKGGFDIWGGGEYRRQFKDAVKSAEKEGWVEADKARRIWLAKKVLSSLKDKVNNTNTINAYLKDYVTAFNKYKAGSIGAYDLELKRLQTVDALKEIIVNKDAKDYVIVADFDNVPPGDVWMDPDNNIHVGGWRALSERNFTKKERQLFTGLDAWCDEEGVFDNNENECGVEIHIDWPNWTLVKKDIKRANDNFWKIKQEQKIQDKLNEIKNQEANYSSQDKTLITKLVVSINSLKNLATSFDGKNVTDFQYKILIEKDKINDLLDKAENQGIAEIAIAKADGFHEYDDWSNTLRGVSIYSDDNIEIFVRVHKKFSPFFVKDDKPEYEIQVDVIWKEWVPELKPKLEQAFKMYEATQSAKRFDVLVEKRGKVISDFNEISNKVEMYESGEMSLSELKNFINKLYFKLQAYDMEVAYLAAVSNNTFPDWTPIEVKIKTEHVDLNLYERDFTYRFGIGVGLMQKNFGRTRIRGPLPIGEENKQEMLVWENDGMPNEKTPIITGRVSANLQEDKVQKGFESNEGSVDYSKEAINGNMGDYEKEELTKEDLKEIEKEKQMREKMLFETRQEMARETGEMFSDTMMADRSLFLGEERKNLKGLKPTLRIKTKLTSAEIKKLAEEFKEKFEEAKEKGIIDDAIYNLNLELDNHPSMQQAIVEWGNTTTSIKLTYENESIFEFSFRTEDGYVEWAEMGVAENAGNSSDNIYIEVSFESLMELKNWWEGTLRDSEGPSAVFKAIPGFIGKVGKMIMIGKIKVKPFKAITKIPKFLQVFFNGMIHTIGVTV